MTSQTRRKTLLCKHYLPCNGRMGGTKVAKADGSKPIITILGLGTTGASIGLALQRLANAVVEVVGHDKAPDAARTAGKLKAVHRTG